MSEHGRYQCDKGCGMLVDLEMAEQHEYWTRHTFSPFVAAVSERSEDQSPRPSPARAPRNESEGAAAASTSLETLPLRDRMAFAASTLRYAVRENDDNGDLHDWFRPLFLHEVADILDDASAVLAAASASEQGQSTPPARAPSQEDAPYTREELESDAKWLTPVARQHEEECKFSYPDGLEEGDECTCGTSEAFDRLVRAARAGVEDTARLTNDLRLLGEINTRLVDEASQRVSKAREKCPGGGRGDTCFDWHCPDCFPHPRRPHRRSDERPHAGREQGEINHRLDRMAMEHGTRTGRTRASSGERVTDEEVARAVMGFPGLISRTDMQVVLEQFLDGRRKRSGHSNGESR